MKKTTASGADSRSVRVERLRASRVQDSEAKTARALVAVQDLLGAGQRITIAQVARDASVSTWFVYNQPQVRDAVRAAMQEQSEIGRAATGKPGGRSVTPAGLHTELALAREEIRDLRKERDQLRKRVQLSLGANLEGVNHDELIECMQKLERRNTELVSDIAGNRDRADALEQRVRELEDELSASRASLRRMIRKAPDPVSQGQPGG